MWPPLGAFMWMQQTQSQLQDHFRERVYSSRHIRRLFGVYPRYPQIFAPYSRAVCHVIFAAVYSVIRSLSTLILLQANNTNKYYYVVE